jgi:hypothetical protein
MDAADWILALVLGGILGMIGQGIRVVVGLKKLNDQALEANQTFSEIFQGSVLAISLLIGFIAGALAMIGVSEIFVETKPSKELILTLIAAGYAGTDFIEGFIKKYLPVSARKSKTG